MPSTNGRRNISRLATRSVRPNTASQEDLFAHAKSIGVEEFRIDEKYSRIIRTVRMRDGTTRESYVPVDDKVNTSSLVHLAREYDRAWLRARHRPDRQLSLRGTSTHVRVVDLFSGCGLMTLGIEEASRAVRRSCEPVLAIDFNSDAAAVYEANFPGAVVLPTGVETYIDGELDSAPTASERELLREVGEIDFLVGGPPCQGHSDLNNHTRRCDTRNALYLKMARFAQLVRPRHLIVENVRGILHDADNVYGKTRDALRSMGYHVDGALVGVADLGVAQRRQRFVMVASLERPVSVSAMLSPYQAPIRDFAWACEDLIDATDDPVLDFASSPSTTNSNRIRYLFDHDLYDLPDHERPKCHRDNDHTYRSVYGRLKWTEAAQTITTGFGSMGQGRYVHPRRRRTITPHEAARLQFVPDFFRFDGVRRAALAEMIGNGVPPKLTYALALELLR